MGTKSLFVTYLINPYSDNTTTWATLAGTLQGVTPEALTHTPIRKVGTISNLNSYVTTNTTLVTNVITIRNNSANTTVTVSYTSSQTGEKEDLVNTATVAATDELDYQIAMTNDTSGAKVMTIGSISSMFTASTTIYLQLLVVGAVGTNSIITTASTTYYLDGGTVYDAAATEIPIEFLNSYTASNLYSYVNSNARTTTTTFTFRKNLAAGNQTVNYTSLQTGVKEDTVNTDTIVSGDDIGINAATSTGTGALSLNTLSVNLTTADEHCTDLIAAVAVGRTMSAAAVYGCLGGVIPEPTYTTEAYSRTKAQFNTNLTNFRTYVSANTATSANTCVVKIDNVASALSISYAVAETGLKRDTDVVNVTSASYMAFNFNRGTANSFLLHFAVVTAYEDAGGIPFSQTAVVVMDG